MVSTAEELSCTRCRLAKHRTRVVPGTGDSDTWLALIGEAPGKDEDIDGHPFVGRAGQHLNNILQSVGLIREELFLDNVVHCRPPNNDLWPYPDATSLCPTLYLQRNLDSLQNLRCIVTLGATAGALYFPGKRAMEQADLARVLPSGIIVIGAPHPSYALRTGPAITASIRDSLVRAIVYRYVGRAR